MGIFGGKFSKGQSIEVIDHGGLQFSEEIKGSGYYIVYSWGKWRFIIARTGYAWTLK